MIVYGMVYLVFLLNVRLSPRSRVSVPDNIICEATPSGLKNLSEDQGFA